MTCHGLASKASYELVILVHEDHGLHVVVIVAHANVNLLHFLAIFERHLFIQGHLLAELRRMRPIAEVEAQRANDVNCGPLDFGDAEGAQRLFLLEYLELRVFQRLEVWPLRLL